ncbi:MAG: hypothetical protein Q7R31_03085 [Candidatus Levybacteria bacterium]|nr:hypothetical protein [Candidatus Levybacteria bacterium]
MENRNRFKGWKTFRYLTWYDISQAGGQNPPDFKFLDFNFTLPPEESSQFSEAINRSPDLVEDAFQNVYPGLFGEKGIKRLIVKKLTITDNIITKKIEDRERNEFYRKQDPKENRPKAYNTVLESARTREVDFSKPVGEIVPQTP